MATKNNIHFTEQQIEKIFAAIEYDLFTKPKLPFSLDKKWNLNFPDKPGVYAIFEKNKFVYIGETSDLRERMKDIRRTYNHTFRGKLGTIRLKAKKEGNLFSKDVEIALDNYMVKHLEFTCHALSFGRKEVEGRIYTKFKKQLLNSESLRGAKHK